MSRAPPASTFTASASPIPALAPASAPAPRKDPLQEAIEHLRSVIEDFESDK